MQPHRAVHCEGNLVGDMHIVMRDGLCALLANFHHLTPDDDRDSGVGVNGPQFF